MPKLFPPFLNMGSKDGAVRVLQQHLFSLGYAVNGLSVSGNYRHKTGASVAKMQVALGIEPDENCGPQTRAALKEQRGVDLDAIPWRPEDGVTIWLGEGCEPGGSEWPPREERAAMTESAEGPPVTGA